ncbi:thymidylate synthase [Rathayibacter tritici]|uniref:Thymidylate synthase n=1 Tax=Rathayibacter tritici TaxID=33888 RepID=A0A160KPY3_9MICO|nr:thymidylate synthase [Rathayibacter tritici]PPF26945.1 thymidylate synthase [Rathayibacter tritici]PPF67671.1 thymidylate synthase [Rathayibacter tritici]PPG06265.1 thymidylate synthase [Rathayibacter tritici]PPI16960.1 thymidylate synthase [Rathayibacter tritici]
MSSSYEWLLRDVRLNGSRRSDRTGTGTLSVFGRHLRYDLGSGFPLVTTKRVHFPSIAQELFWFLRGETNVGWLRERGVSIWDEWADESGDLGPIYGAQWRRWGTKTGESIDQIARAVEQIRFDPSSRRIVVSAWNVGEIDDMALAPCHVLFQFYVDDDRLSCHVYQRSADLFLGVPFNLASYALLTHLIADHCALTVGELVWSAGDCHIYLNHLDQVDEQLSRRPFPFPTLSLRRHLLELDQYGLDDVELANYRAHGVLRAPVAR